MRSREEIERASRRGDETVKLTDRVLLEVLLDIRELLIAEHEGVARCPHGFTGVCMYCVRDGDLLRPHAPR